MTERIHQEPTLTKNQALVMAALAEADGPLSAYTILDRLRDRGFRAPLQVYRALDKLLAFGLVHRLESLKAFVACRRMECARHEMIVFAICEICRQVDEIPDEVLANRIKMLIEASGFSLGKSTVELRGICRKCQII